MLPDLIKTTELFLVPSSFLVAALGTADTNLHRAAVSLFGLTVSILWLGCAREALSEAIVKPSEAVRTNRFRVLAWFPLVWVVAWFASVVIHLVLAGQPLGKTGLSHSFQPRNRHEHRHECRHPPAIQDVKG